MNDSKAREVLDLYLETGLYNDIGERVTQFEEALQTALGWEKENQRLKAEAKMGNIPYKEAMVLKEENKRLREACKVAHDKLIYACDYFDEHGIWDMCELAKKGMNACTKALEQNSKDRENNELL